jgi:cysteate synthase
MVNAWAKKSRALFPEDLDPERINEITTRVISSRYPAYSIKGGVYDALTASGGAMYGIENEAVYESMDLFEETEGIDIVPAAGVAVAALRKAVKGSRINRKDVILLNITGGGEHRLKKEKITHRVKPVFVSKDISDEKLEELLCSLLKTA